MNKDELLALIAGKTDEQIRKILEDNYKISWLIDGGNRKHWYAQVFTYSNGEQLQEELNFFLWLVNFFSGLFHFCFEEEDTVFLGCVCPCGKKQTILYYSLTATS